MTFVAVALATVLRSLLSASNSPKLVSNTGRILIGLSHAQSGDAEFDRGIELMRLAINLDPGNSKWADALESAHAESGRPASDKATLQPETPPQPAAVRLSAEVAEANLVSKTDPVYPPTAIAISLSGVVKFTILVGTDGKVQNLTLLSGHPMLVQPAKDAVLTYLYRPAFEDGKAVPFETRATVRFR